MREFTASSPIIPICIYPLINGKCTSKSITADGIQPLPDRRKKPTCGPGRYIPRLSSASHIIPSLISGSNFRIRSFDRVYQIVVINQIRRHGIAVHTCKIQHIFRLFDQKSIGAPLFFRSPGCSSAFNIFQRHYQSVVIIPANYRRITLDITFDIHHNTDNTNPVSMLNGSIRSVTPERIAQLRSEVNATGHLDTACSFQ